MERMGIVSQELTVKAEMQAGYEAILTAEAGKFIERLHSHFGKRRDALVYRSRISGSGKQLPCGRNAVSAGSGSMIRSAESGTHTVWMADFDTPVPPAWECVMATQLWLKETVGSLTLGDGQGGHNAGDRPHRPPVTVRPRGWLKDEPNVWLDGRPVSASLFDFGLFFFHCAKGLAAENAGPWISIPPAADRFQARLWNEVIVYAQNDRRLPLGTTQADIGSGTLMAEPEWSGIRYELKEHLPEQAYKAEKREACQKERPPGELTVL